MKVNKSLKKITMPTKKQLANLRPLKKGDRIAAKQDDERKDMILAGRVDPENVAAAKALIVEHGTKSKVINHLLSQQL